MNGRIAIPVDRDPEFASPAAGDPLLAATMIAACVPLAPGPAHAAAESWMPFPEDPPEDLPPAGSAPKTSPPPPRPRRHWKSAKSPSFSGLDSGRREANGAGVTDYLYRDYDPVTGRWASRDPIKERGGLNLYGLVRNNPVGDYDRLGLEGCKSKLLTYQHYFSVAPPDGFTVQNWRQWAHGWADLLLSDGGWEGTASGGAGALIVPSWSKVSITFGASIVCSSKKSSGPESDEDCVASLSTSGKYSESDGITSIGVEADPGAAGVSNIISVDFTATVGYGGSSSVGAGVGNYSANLSFPDGAVHTSIAVGTGTWRCECSK